MPPVDRPAGNVGADLPPGRGYGQRIMRITEMIVGILVVVAVLSYGTLAAVTLLT